MVRALLEPFLQQARAAGLPAWVEANGEHARDVYTHFGFRVVEEVVIGKGLVDQCGNRTARGEGIVIYAMILEPQQDPNGRIASVMSSDDQICN